MVSPGQFLERPTLIPVVPRVVLEGLSHRGRRIPPLLIVPPTPEEGGGMDHVVAAEIAWAAAMAGFPSIRFNFRGVGASQGKSVGLDSWVEDIEAAARVLEENTGLGDTARVYLGASGAAALGAAVDRASDRVRGLCLISPFGLDLNALARTSLPLLVIQGERDLRTPSTQLSRAVAEAGGVLERIPAADAAFLRNLPEVGKRLVKWLESLSVSSEQ